MFIKRITGLDALSCVLKYIVVLSISSSGINKTLRAVDLFLVSNYRLLYVKIYDFALILAYKVTNLCYSPKVSFDLFMV